MRNLNYSLLFVGNVRTFGLFHGTLQTIGKHKAGRGEICFRPFFMGAGNDPTDLKTFGASVYQTGKAKMCQVVSLTLVTTLKRNRVSVSGGNTDSLPPSSHNNSTWYSGEAGLRGTR